MNNEEDDGEKRRMIQARAQSCQSHDKQIDDVSDVFASRVAYWNMNGVRQGLYLSPLSRYLLAHSISCAGCAVSLKLCGSTAMHTSML